MNRMTMADEQPEMISPPPRVREVIEPPARHQAIEAVTAPRTIEPADRAGKYLTFALGAEEFGVAVLKVREIIKVIDITQVPQVPQYVRGVVNLRGKVIPVVDLRLRFGLPAQAYDERTCIIVVEVNLGTNRIMMGVVVDSVSEVLNLNGAEIDDPPAFGDGISTDFVLGLAKVGGAVKILLDLDRVLGRDSLGF